MATRPSLPSSAPLPAGLLFFPAGPSSFFQRDFIEALNAAVVAEAKGNVERRHERCRIAHLLCELTCSLLRMEAIDDKSAELPVARGELAGLLGISLVRVKRALALLALSQVVRTDGQTIRVIDWQRLCSVAGFDPARLGIDASADDEMLTIVGDDEQSSANFVTASGDPACFV